MTKPSDVLRKAYGTFIVKSISEYNWLKAAIPMPPATQRLLEGILAKAVGLYIAVQSRFDVDPGRVLRGEEGRYYRLSMDVVGNMSMRLAHGGSNDIPLSFFRRSHCYDQFLERESVCDLPKSDFDALVAVFRSLAEARPSLMTISDHVEYDDPLNTIVGKHDFSDLPKGFDIRQALAEQIPRVLAEAKKHKQANQAL